MVARPWSMENKCFLYKLGFGRYLLFSTTLSNCADSAQKWFSSSQRWSNHCATVETENLVSTSHRISSRASHSSTKKTDNIKPCNRKSHRKCNLKLDCMHFFGKTLREKGISREVIKILAAGWWESTIKTYHYLINDTLSTDIPKDGMLWIKI